MTANRMITTLRAFVRGAGSILDLGGLSYNERPHARGGVLEALRNDVRNVGNDFRAAIRIAEGNQGLDTGGRFREMKCRNEFQE